MSTRLEEAIRKLTPEQVRSVEDYAEFLAARKQSAPKPMPSKPKFNWAGMAKDIPAELDSVQLHHEATQARAER